MEASTNTWLQFLPQLFEKERAVSLSVKYLRNLLLDSTTIAVFIAPMSLISDTSQSGNLSFKLMNGSFSAKDT